MLPPLLGEARLKRPSSAARASCSDARRAFASLTCCSCTSVCWAMRPRAAAAPPPPPPPPWPSRGEASIGRRRARAPRGELAARAAGGGGRAGGCAAAAAAAAVDLPRNSICSRSRTISRPAATTALASFRSEVTR